MNTLVYVYESRIRTSYTNYYKQLKVVREGGRRYTETLQRGVYFHSLIQYNYRTHLFRTPNEQSFARQI